MNNVNFASAITLVEAAKGAPGVQEARGFLSRVATRDFTSEVEAAEKGLVEARKAEEVTRRTPRHSKAVAQLKMAEAILNSAIGRANDPSGWASRKVTEILAKAKAEEETVRKAVEAKARAKAAEETKTSKANQLVAAYLATQKASTAEAVKEALKGDPSFFASVLRKAEEWRTTEDKAHKAKLLGMLK